MRQRPHISFMRSFLAAGRGLKEAISEQRNLRIHLAVAILVAAGAAFLRLPLWNCLVLLLCVGIVIAIELFNTAIETVVDLVSPAEHDLARKAKDISAAAVLVTAAMAAGIGLLIFVPAVWTLFSR